MDEEIPKDAPAAEPAAAAKPARKKAAKKASAKVEAKAPAKVAAKGAPKRKAPAAKKTAAGTAPAGTATVKKTTRKKAAGDMSDAAVKARTGRTWDQWFAVLDKAGAAKMTHRAIAELLATRHKIPGWWAQMVTVAYERARGLRRVNETLTGFRTSVSRTLDVGRDRVFAALDDAKSRAAILKEAVELSTRTPGKNLRFGWKVGRVEVRFVIKGRKKTQVTVDHTGLKSAADVSRLKEQWAASMDRLKKRLKRD